MSDAKRPRASPRGLGRGLSALFGEDEVAAPAASQHSVAIELLAPGRFQPRHKFDEESMRALTESVRAQGILQPILVRRNPDNANTYEILAGERRWRAAQGAQLHEVPVIVRELDDRAASEIALVENIQREDLNAIDEALGYQRLIDEFGHTQEALALALGKSRSHIANTLRLLNLPKEVQAMCADGRISAGHARALVLARDPLEIAKDIVLMGLSVRQVENYVKSANRAPNDTGRKPPPKDPNIRALEQELTTSLGLKVTIATQGAGGSLTIKYRSLDQLDAVLAKLRAGQ